MHESDEASLLGAGVTQNMPKKTSSTSKATAKKAPAKKPPAKSAAKKTPAKKTPVKKSAPKTSAKAPAVKKTGTKKAVSKKSVTKKPVTKKVTTTKVSTSKTPAKKSATTKKAPASKAAATKKAASKKPVAKKAPASKPATKKAVTKKVVTKKVVTKKTVTKKVVTQKTVSKKAASTPAKPAAGKAEPKLTKEQQAEADKKAGRKGITIVTKKVSRRARVKVEIPKFISPGGPLLGPGSKQRSPLIASGPKNTVAQEKALLDADRSKRKKSPFNKRKLDRYKAILLEKRRVLVDEMNNLEHQALKSESGALSSLPQHSAEQGSDTNEQSINLGMANTDRALIREIDAALERIGDGVFGLCERTGMPISEDRLEELPWAKLSIEAARASDRSFRR